MPWLMTWSGSSHYLLTSYAALSISGSTWHTKEESLHKFTSQLSTHHRWRTGRTKKYSLRIILTPTWLQARSWKCSSQSRQQINNHKTWPPSEKPWRGSLSSPLNWQQVSSPSWSQIIIQTLWETSPWGQPPPSPAWWSSPKTGVRKLVIWIIILPTHSLLC